MRREEIAGLLNFNSVGRRGSFWNLGVKLRLKSCVQICDKIIITA